MEFKRLYGFCFSNSEEKILELAFPLPLLPMITGYQIDLSSGQYLSSTPEAQQ